MSRGFADEDAWRAVTHLAPRWGAAVLWAHRGYRRFAPQPPATVWHAFGVSAFVVDVWHAFGVRALVVDATRLGRSGADLSSVGSSANPKDCQKVAGGRRVAKTSGPDGKRAGIPQGCQNGPP